MTMESNSYTPRTIKASEFKAKCLKLMDEVAETGEEIIITKEGKTMVKLTSCREKEIPEFGRHRDRVRIVGDIVSPMPAEWFEIPGEAEDNLF